MELAKEVAAEANRGAAVHSAAKSRTSWPSTTRSRRTSRRCESRAKTFWPRSPASSLHDAARRADRLDRPRRRPGQAAVVDQAAAGEVQVPAGQAARARSSWSWSRWSRWRRGTPIEWPDWPSFATRPAFTALGAAAASRYPTCVACTRDDVAVAVIGERKGPCWTPACFVVDPARPPTVATHVLMRKPDGWWVVVRRCTLVSVTRSPRRLDR